MYLKFSVSIDYNELPTVWIHREFDTEVFNMVNMVYIKYIDRVKQRKMCKTQSVCAHSVALFFPENIQFLFRWIIMLMSLKYI